MSYCFEGELGMTKILKFLFSREIEVAPGVFWLGGYLYENRNQPTTPRPLKFKKRDTSQTGTRALYRCLFLMYDTFIHKGTR
jgi:hypothetical protein